MSSGSPFQGLREIMEGIPQDQREKLDAMFVAVFRDGVEHGRTLERLEGAIRNNRASTNHRPTQGMSKRSRVIARGLAKIKQPLKLRHLNFGETKRRYDDEALFVLVCRVKEEQIRASRQGKRLADVAALRNLAPKIFVKNKMRQSQIETEIKNRLAPQLSRAAKKFKPNAAEIARVAEAWAAL